MNRATRPAAVMSRSVVLTNARVATLEPHSTPYGLIDDGAIGIAEGLIRWVGPRHALPAAMAGWPVEDLGGRLITPALVDCHTHLVFGGNRAREFEQRLQGVSYADIAKAGGGIRATVAATRQASEDELIALARPRLAALMAEGVKTVEIKSGYGLDLDTEMKMLRAARRLGEAMGVRVRTTFLGAHTVPPEYEGRADAYIDYLCQSVLPAIAPLADAVDGFCEHIAFSPAQIARVFDAAAALGLPVKLHAEQLSNQGGAVMAAARGALSVDHLEYLDPADAVRLGGTVAVLLPGAFFTLRETRQPPLEALRAAGVPLAVASDCNPGSSPLTSLLLAMNMACTLFRMTPEEALAGTTREAARALGLADTLGTVGVGKCADLAVWDLEHPAELAYRMGFNPLYRVW